MKKAANIILGMVWALGLYLTGGSASVDSFSAQIFVSVIGISVFAASSAGLIINNRR